MNISKTLIVLIIVSTFSMSLVFAQRTNTKRKTQSRPASSASRTSPTQTRARRAVTPATQEAETARPETSSNDATAQSSPVGTVSPNPSPAPPASSNEKPAEKTPVKQPEPVTAETTAAPVTDPILALRDQIGAAATPQDRIRLQLQLADLLASSGKKSEAVAELHAVTALDVFDPQGFYNTGNALARLGDSDEAVNAYRRAIEQRKGSYSRALNNLGVVLLRVGRWDEAHDAFMSALRIENFRYAEASYNLGRLYSARGQADLAIREWRRALAVNPKHASAAQSIARAGNEDRIVEQPATDVARETRNRPASTRSAAPIQNQPSTEGERDTWIRSTPMSPAAAIKKQPLRNSTQSLSLDTASFSYLQKARSASERGNKIEAIENYQHLISRQNGYFGPANLELGYVLISLKRNDEAMASLLLVANREGSRYPISYYHLARLYEGKGDLKQAEAAFQRTVAAYGNKNSQFLLDLSRIREKQGNFKGALEAMEQYLSLAKKDGQEIIWSEDRLSALRQKAAAPTPK